MPGIYAKKRREAPAAEAAPPAANVLPGFYYEDVSHCVFCGQGASEGLGLVLEACQAEVPLYVRRLRRDGVLYETKTVARCVRHYRTPYEVCETCRGIAWWETFDKKRICQSCYPAAI